MKKLICYLTTCAIVLAFFGAAPTAASILPMDPVPVNVPGGQVLINVMGREIIGYTGSPTIIDTGSISGLIAGTPIRIGSNAFSGCTSLTTLTTHTGFTTIGSDAFEGCSNLAAVTISSTVTAIGSGAFTKCANASFSVDAANAYYSSAAGVMYDKAFTTLLFMGASKLASLSLPAGVYKIGDNAFSYFTMTEYTIPAQISIIGKSAFSFCSNLTGITIPSTVNLIDSGAFSSCSKLDNVVIPISITMISSSCFTNCKALKSINIPVTVNSIGSGAFAGCTSLESIALPSSITTISSACFSGCTSMKSFSIPSSIKTIGDSAFAYSGLTSITIPDGVTSIGDSGFSYCASLTAISIPSSVTSIARYLVRGCQNLTSLMVDSENAYYCSEGNVLFNKDKSSLLICPESKAGSYTVPGSVTTIAAQAFADCSQLTAITLPAGLNKIDVAAFAGCSRITAIELPSGITTIYSSTFISCSSLAEIIIPNGVTSIETQAFYNCSSLSSITIPASVTAIGTNAFYNCSALTIYGINGSYAQQYALDKNITFVVITPTPDSSDPVQRDSIRGDPNQKDVIMTSTIATSTFYGYTILEVGTLVIKESTLGSWILDIDNPVASKIICRYLNNQNPNELKFYAAIWNIPDEAIGQSVVCRAYVKYDDNGTVKYVYGPIKTYKILA